ncbi:MAG: bifunctional [glutamate--ammonia ligase]-adenylyl-L-tyrosine phosphorylase/[glutamate--ammonia-ligase] adenylyltransferase [Comamonadaceae bacterium]|nr:MAG: bifunctional [glutamate--ammonia ligase]-adenylyl-L-tyrosine phosphorylase/[glutamate--ammonia-ligase] adenylyltransferase [Comamonadaceae bacterium]
MTAGSVPGSADGLLSDVSLPAVTPHRTASPTVPSSADSRFVQRLRRRYADVLALLAPGIPTRAHMRDAYAVLRGQGRSAGDALRTVRQLVMERLVVLDCDQRCELAEFALDAACIEAFAELDAAHGMPTTADGARAQLWIVGMGKLGARELNVSSDIDLIYLYDQDGETAGAADGRGRLPNQEYFARAVKRIYALVGDITEHGFVFRVDLALRPNGNSGPSVVSLDALEEYLQVQGREWERFAWLKSRVVAPAASVANGSAQALRSVVLPFVFRKYLDYNVFESLRVLHRQIREQAARRSAGRPERANDVKLSRGGIREIEFIVQLLQVVRGGQFPELRTRPTLEGLQRVARAGLMPQETADALARAYVFLRQVEHRIQYLDDQQTHMLPVADDDLNWIAQTLGFADCCAFLGELDTHRELVAEEFDRLLGGSEQRCNGGTCKGGPKGAPSIDLSELLAELPPAFATRMQAWSEHPRILALRDDTRARLRQLVRRTGQWLRETDEDGEPRPVEAALRWADWIEPLLRRDSYLALLVERPVVQDRLLRLLASAKWPARYLLQHPDVIDELAGPQMLAGRFDAAEFEAELQARHASLSRTGEADEEALMSLLRRAHHAEVFRTLARDVDGHLTVEQVADDLSALADTVLRITARWCWPLVRNRHREVPQFAVIGYGKLGGKELGYGSDLDIVFVYEDDDERAGDVYAAYVRKLINWLTVKTREGDLFEIDTALRPNGNSGLLTTSFEAYEKYQLGRGSNTAWTWEHQAMTRARFVLGDPALGARFDGVREAVIVAPRNHAALKAEIMAMREKVRSAHSIKAGRFDVKHSPGGMVDAEFAVQYLVLSASAAHPELIPNLGNIALLARAEKAGLLPEGVGRNAGSAYRELRRVQHRARLNEEPTQVTPPLLAKERDAMLALWKAVFG